MLSMLSGSGASSQGREEEVRGARGADCLSVISTIGKVPRLVARMCGLCFDSTLAMESLIRRSSDAKQPLYPLVVGVEQTSRECSTPAPGAFDRWSKPGQQETMLPTAARADDDVSVG